ncbi:hypothetical protein Trco_001408 [Trichoderma cornu-damae]|uniref:Uncharacterized protein n=1 Tax=Trichoderma cornu-damae TaxID=654480 RepID=A0A9P8QXW1_9HYPO|nr:hypothetical protein Trco_001408 [Trichoderma cornu-damae]
MDHAARMLRREGEHTDHPIGLGWLLAIALCGGILLFTTVGLLLVWWVRKSRQPGPRTVYGYAPTQGSFMPPPSSRLVKRRFLGYESISKLSSRLSSRFSLSGAPAQPPLPTHESLQLPERRRTVSRGRKRSRSWVDEDDLHGPKMARNKRNERESWSGRDNWFGPAPTLPNVGTVPEEGNVRAGGVPLQHPQPRWLPLSYTEPRLASMSNSAPLRRDDLPMGIAPIGGMMMPVPPPARIRPSATDSDLRGILRSTDMRLSERSSRSSAMISRSCAVRRSPTRTPRSHRTGSSGRSGRGGWRVSGSPPKGSASHTGSRNNSTSSAGSAANSLIVAATNELELPGGFSSPSKARGVRWQQQAQQMANGSPERAQWVNRQTQSPQGHSFQRQKAQVMMVMPHAQMQAPQMRFPQLRYPHPQLPFPYTQQHPPMPPIQQRSPQKSPERRVSLDSDKSSSLSTLYSTNEPEEEGPRQRQEDDDPFVENGGPRRWPSWQMRQRPADIDSQRRAKTLSSASLTGLAMGHPSCPLPLRPISAVSQPDMGYRGLLSPLLLEPRAMEFARDASGAGGSALSKAPYLCEAPSEVSFVSMSVDSDATEVPASETPRVDWLDSSDSASSSPATPTRKTKFPDVSSSSSSSSPYDEREIMSLLLATAPPHGALPLPPPSLAGPGDSIVTILSPPPRGGLARQASTSSSIYTLESFLAEPGVALSASPSRRSTIHPLVEGPRVSNTVAELRRMNSMISTYSVASLASTVAGEGESPTAPAPLSDGGGLARPRSALLGPASIGSRHYLNVGNTTSTAAGGSHRYGPRGSRHRRAETYHYGKENRGLGLRLSCIMDETLDLAPQEDAQGVNFVCEPAMEIIEGISANALNPKFGPAGELIAADQGLDENRASVESLGLYDNDGFLLSSPERDAKRRGLRIPSESLKT